MFPWLAVRSALHPDRKNRDLVFGREATPFHSARPIEYSKEIGSYEAHHQNALSILALTFVHAIKILMLGFN